MDTSSVFSLCLDSYGSLYVTLSEGPIYHLTNNDEEAEEYVFLTVEKTKDGTLDKATFVSPKGLCWDDDLALSSVSQKELKPFVNSRFRLTSGMWVADDSDHTIRLIHDDIAITVAGTSRVQGKVDGRARISQSHGNTKERSLPVDENYSLEFVGPPGYPSTRNAPQYDSTEDASEPFATLDSPLHAVRVPHHPLVLITPTQGQEYRLLNLTTWMVSTLTMMAPIPPAAEIVNPWIIPVKDPQRNQTSSAEAGILLLSRTLGEPFRLSLPQRKITPLPVTNSSSSAPTFMVPIASSSAPLRGKICYGEGTWFIEAVHQRDDGKLVGRGDFGQQCAFSPRLGLRHTGSSERALSRWVWADTTEPRPHPDEGRKLKVFDVSCLINCPSLPQDLILRHEVSSTTWTLPLDVLKVMHPSMPPDLLRSTILSSPLPLASIDAFIRYLFMARLPLGPDWRRSSRIWHHTFDLLDDSNSSFHSVRPLLYRLEKSFLPSLSEDDACLCLIDAWEGRKLVKPNSFFFQLLSAVVQRFHSTHIRKYYHPPPPSRFEILSAHLTDPEDVSFLQRTKSSAIGYNLDYPGYPGLLTYKAVSWTEHASFPPPPLSSLLKTPSDFVLGFPIGGDQSMAIICNMYYLYSRWRWFKLKLDEKGSFNERARTALLPIGMTQSIATAILEAVHTEIRVELTEAEALVVLERGAEWFLIDSSQEPLAPFTGIWKRALSITFPQLNIENYARLRSLAERLNLMKQIAKINAFVSQPQSSSSS